MVLGGYLSACHSFQTKFPPLPVSIEEDTRHLTLISDQENTEFYIKYPGATERVRLGKGKIITVEVADLRGAEIFARPDGYIEKSITLAEHPGSSGLRFPAWEISEKIGHRPEPNPSPSMPEPYPVRTDSAVDPGNRKVSYAVCIGISEYADPEIGRLGCAAKDALDLAALLEAQPSFGKDNVCVLTDKNATRINIHDALAGFLAKADGNDTIWVYWSGHGYPEPDDPRKVYFACYDTRIREPYTGFLMDDVRRFLDENRARNKIVIIDTCHAGKVVTRAVPVLPKLENVPPGTVFLLATDTERRAAESWAWGNGALTHVLLQGLSGAADGVLGQRDGTVTFGELRYYVAETMPRETQKIVGRALVPMIATNVADPAINNLPLVHVLRQTKRD